MGTPYEVLLTQLGKYWLDSRYPNGTNPAAIPVPAPSGTPPIPEPTQPPTTLPTAPPATVAVPSPTPVGTNCEPVAPERKTVIGHSGPVAISNVQAAGTEYVEIRNDGSDPADLGGWTLRDKNEVAQHYVFPAGSSLAASASLQVYTEPGHPDSFNSNRSIWNNCGDALELLNAGGIVVATYAYGTHCLTADCH